MQKGILTHWVVISGIDHNEARWEKTHDVDRVQLSNMTAESQPFTDSTKLFGYVLGVASLGPKENQGTSIDAGCHLGLLVMDLK